MHETPQSGTWLFCFMAIAGISNAVYHIPDKEYESVRRIGAVEESN
jgi:hypothetical protein